MMDRRGQGALFDAMAFLVIMAVASSAMYAYSGALARDARTASAASEIEYARGMLASLSRATISGASYFVGGEQCALGDSPAAALIVEELAMLASGTEAEFSALNGRLAAAAESLSGGRQWSLSCSYDGASANFSLGTEAPQSRSSASLELQMAGGLPGRASVVLSIWRP